MKNHKKIMQNIRCRPSEPRHPLAKYNRKFYSNFWRILSEKRIFLAQKSRSWVKISKIATKLLHNPLRWIGSPIFMPFRQRNRCELDWRHFFVSENPKSSQIWPGMTTRNGKPMVSHRLGREVWEILRFFGKKSRRGRAYRFRCRNGMKIGDPPHLTVL